jgi:hypothetical protein
MAPERNPALELQSQRLVKDTSEALRVIIFLLGLACSLLAGIMAMRVLEQ